MRLLYFSIFLIFLSCNNQRVLQLPEVEYSEITEVLDVSPAYIFYDETQPDSTLMNRKNLISTTNWLVNIDKRLTLQQAIPHIKYLQKKRKKKSMHKNEDAKNYFTCNDLSQKNLGFIEFTGVEFSFSEKKSKELNTELLITDETFLKYNQLDSLKVIDQFSSLYYRNIDLKFGFKDGKYFIFDDFNLLDAEVDIKYFFKYLENRIKNDGFANAFRIKLHFHNALTFQDYINIKSKLKQLDIKNITIDKNEFIY